MTELEQQVLADGFRVLLLAVDARPEQRRLAFEARLFDGGRLKRAFAWAGDFYAPAPEALLTLRRLLLEVIVPPHLLAGWGRGWLQLMSEQFPNLLSQFRAFDLAETAAALTGLLPRAPLEEFARSFGLGTVAVTESCFPPVIEELLWAVFARAGGEGLMPADLPGLVEQRRLARATFKVAGRPMDAGEFPETPAVYIMKGKRGRVLYVGKAANLARRLQSYFQNSWTLTGKIEALRERVARIDYRAVGSEIEALLLEWRLIRELAPELNVQRNLELGEAETPYAGHAAVVVIADSAEPGCTELFFLGQGMPALQLRLHPRRWPAKTLRHLLRFVLGQESTPPASRQLTAWGPDGSVIAQRYVQRFHNSLRWLGVSHGLDLPEAELRTAVEAAAASREPAEFRLAEE